MTIPGSVVLNHLKEAVQKSQLREKELRTQSKVIDDEIKELIARRAEDVLKLARHYLPDLSRESIAGTLTAIQSDLERLLKQKEQRLEELARQRQEADSVRERTEQYLSTITMELNQKVKQRESLEQTVASALAQNPEFQTLSQEALTAETRLAQNEACLAEIQAEAKAKLPAYENSRLFTYLYSRNFGTDKYRSRGITRRLDRWVAQLIDYYPARTSYEFLKQTPRLMQEEFHRRKAAFDVLMAQVEELEQFAADEAGLTEALHQGEETGKQRDGLVAELDRQKSRCQSLQQELLQLQQGQGPYYEQAVDRLRRFLTETETALLEEHAQRTADTADDDLVRSLVALGEEIDRISPQVQSLSVGCKSLEEQSSGLDFIVRRYQQSNFDSDRSCFNADFDVSLFLDRYLNGQLTRDELWQTIRRSQNFTPTWSENSMSKLGEAISSPGGQVILHAMVEVAGALLESAAHRSVTRRSSSASGRSSSGQGQSQRSISSSSSSPSPKPSKPNRGFTSGNGF